MGSSGIFFISEFDLTNKNTKKYKQIVVNKLKEILPSFDEDNNYVMYKTSNTAIRFDNIKKKPEDFKGTWSYKEYIKLPNNSQIEDTYRNIYYGIFKKGELVEIYRLEKEDILKALVDKLENISDTSRQNILDSMVKRENIVYCAE